MIMSFQLDYRDLIFFFSKPGCDLSNNGIMESYLNFEISTVSLEDLESNITGFKASFG